MTKIRLKVEIAGDLVPVLVYTIHSINTILKEDSSCVVSTIRSNWRMSSIKVFIIKLVNVSKEAFLKLLSTELIGFMSKAPDKYIGILGVK